MARPGKRASGFRLGPVKAETAALIRMMLDAPDPVIVKSAIQRACELFEAGQAFTDPRFLEAALHLHIRSPDLKVRRWSYKLAGRLRANSLLPLLREAIDTEAVVDAENRSWALAAYTGYAPVAERKRLIEQLGSEFYQTPLQLASRFFSIGEPEPYRTTLEMRHIENDPLARKWLSMLAGYAATEPRTIHREFSDLEIIRGFVFDTDPESIEYAIWAENRHPEGSYSNLRAAPRQLLEHSNVRRWLFQLITKTEDAVAEHRELLVERMDPRWEPIDVVREGLALGIARLPLLELQRETLDWYAAEAAPGVKLALVDHLARRARNGDNVARAQLQADYAKLDPGDLLAMKIEAAADPEWLADIKAKRRRTIIEVPANGQTELFEKREINIFQGDLYLNSNNRTITQHGPGSSVTGVNMGAMIASTLTALSQNRDQSIAAALPTMEQFVRSLENEQLPDSDRRAAAELVKEVVEAPNEKVRTSKLAMLRSVVRGLLAAPGVSLKFIEDGQKLVQTITSLLP